MFLQQTPEPTGSPLGLLIPLLIAVIFYVIVFMPARKKQKKLEEMIGNLKSGDKVITNGGIYGTIVGFRAERVQLRIAENVKIEVSRNAVAALQRPEEE
jgi:preprotein translocase subunit YajC